MLTETLLSNSFDSHELGLENNNTFRYDRSPSTSIHSLGGGVLIGVRKVVSTHLIPVAESSVKLFISLTLNSLKCILCSVYIPPNSPINIYEANVSTIDLIVHNYPDHIFVFCGDYNHAFKIV